MLLFTKKIAMARAAQYLVRIVNRRFEAWNENPDLSVPHRQFLNTHIYMHDMRGSIGTFVRSNFEPMTALWLRSVLRFRMNLPCTSIDDVLYFV